MEPESVFVQVPDVRLHYMDWGDNGPAVVLLHGGRQMSRSWDAVARGLCRDFRVITLDARGHGESDKPPRGYSYPQRAADIQAFLDALKLDHPFGVAHSTGAMAMAMHGVTYPGRFAKIVLIEAPVLGFRSPPPPGNAPAVRPEGVRWNAPAQQHRVWPSLADMETYLRNHRETGLWREDVMVDVVKHCVDLRADGSVEMKWSVDAYNEADAALNTQDIVLEAPKIKVPTLLMYGTRGVAQEEHYKVLNAVISQSQLMVVDGAGHNVYMEDPDLVNGAIRDFLRSAAPLTHEEGYTIMNSGRLLANGARTE